MALTNTQPYQISNEYNITELLAHFDSNYIFDLLNDKLDNIDYTASLPESNIVASFEQNFKLMNENFPGDSQNIRNIRESVYRNIIDILTKRFNLEFNYSDDTIDLYSAAYYLYDFLVCSRNEIMVQFFTAFIINNKESMFSMLNTEDFRKNKDSAAAYGKRVYDDMKFAVISANITTIINYISTLDIALVNIFQSVYVSPQVVMFLDNAFADKGNFFRDFYCSVLNKPEILPVIITNIRLRLQQIVGTNHDEKIKEIMSYVGDDK